MDRNQAKEFYPILQAYAEGKVIECRTKPSAVEDENVPNEWTEMKDITYWSNIEYRIKPDSKAKAKYRPFANVEECWAEMQNHLPFGWLVDEDSYRSIVICDDESIEVPSFVDDDFVISFKEAMEGYTFADGTPFGIKVEE